MQRGAAASRKPRAPIFGLDAAGAVDLVEKGDQALRRCKTVCLDHQLLHLSPVQDANVEPHPNPAPMAEVRGTKNLDGSADTSAA